MLRNRNTSGNALRTIFSFAMLAFSLIAAAPQTPPMPKPELVELGRFLFSTPELSGDGTISCATCHDPAKSFIDGLADSQGAMKIGIGRNSPTLFGLAHIQGFRDPDQSRYARPGKRGKELSLEDRCLKPITNELEMGASLPKALRALRKLPHMNRRFDRAFGGGGGGVSKARLGKSLAAFVRSLEQPLSPYSRYLRGMQGALSPEQQAGLKLFKQRRCDACHSGPALSDGLMHVVDLPNGPRFRSRERLAAARRTELLRREYAKKAPEELIKMGVRELAAEAEARISELPGGGGYDAAQLEVQTATLWGVTHTGPWFRDGSARTLKQAVTTHIRELNAVAREKSLIKDHLKRVAKQGKRPPKSLRGRLKDFEPPKPLNSQELNSLLSFLSAFSS